MLEKRSNQTKPLSSGERTRAIGYLSGAPRVSTRPEAPAAGPRAHVLGTIDAYRKLGWEVKSYILGDELRPSVEDPGRRSSNMLGHFRGLAADGGRLLFRYGTPRLALQRIGTDVDYVYERFASMQSLGRVYQKRGIPWVLEANGPFFYEAKVERNSMVLTNLARSLEIKAYRQCDVLVCVSDELKRILIEECQIASEKIIVVPNGVDSVRFNPKRAERRRFSDQLTIGFVGSIQRWQGLDLLLTALAKVRAEGLIISAVVVGDGPEKIALEQLARDLGIADHTHFTGHVSWEEIPDYLAGFDLGYSGQITMEIGSMYHSPLKLYEYMAMGLPVVASRFSDASDLDKAGGHAFLFEPNSAENLADALRTAWTRQREFNAWKTPIRSAALKHFTWEVRVGTMVEEIQKRLKLVTARGN